MAGAARAVVDDDGAEVVLLEDQVGELCREGQFGRRAVRLDVLDQRDFPRVVERERNRALSRRIRG